MRPIVKYHGGKYYLSDWIISHFPKTFETYLEPFIGGGSILLAKPYSVHEIINDLDLSLINIWRILQRQPKDFILRLRTVEYIRETFENAKLKILFVDDFQFAINEYILRRMSRGGLKQDFSSSNRLRNGIPGDINGWNTSLDNLVLVAERIQNVKILNMDALRLIEKYDNPNTFIYLDPPYLLETRVAGGYAKELTTNQHIDLSILLHKSKSKCMISGYRNHLYDEVYCDWKRQDKIVANHSGQNKIKQKRIESIWFNY